jgi:hypothetical protein
MVKNANLAPAEVLDKINKNTSLGSNPKSPTCMNKLDLPTNQFIKTKEDLYNMFMDIFIAGHDNVFSVR